MNLLFDHSLPAERFLALGPRTLLHAGGCPSLPCLPASPPQQRLFCPLPPQGAEPSWLPPTLLHEGSQGDCDFAPCCHCVTLPSLGLKTGLGKHISFSSWFVTEREGKLFFSPDLETPLETLVQGGGHPWDLGEQRGGVGQVRGPGEAMWGRQGLAFVPFSPNLWEIMSLPAAIITDYMPFACCIKAACLINIILKGSLGMRETSCFELQ